MIHSPELGELAAALATAQGEFESVSKDSANPFFKSKYASLPNVVKAASPILTAHGLSVSQLLGHDEQGDTLTTVLMHKSGQFIADTMHLRPVKDDPQAQGSATTYGRRYSYMAALGLVADEDDDGNAGSAGSRAPRPSKRSKPSRAVEEGASSPEAGNQSEPASPPALSVDDVKAETDAAELADEATLAELRGLYVKAKLDVPTFGWMLVQAGYGAKPPTKEDEIKEAVRSLTAKQAAALKAELLKATGGQS